MTEIKFNIWSIIILFGAAQGLFMAFYLLTKSENHLANKWLTLLLTVVSLHLIEYAADFTGITLHYPHFIAVSYPLLFCMGPFYYFYCRTLLERKAIAFKIVIVHLIPALAVLLLMLPFYQMSASEKISFIQGLYVNDKFKLPTGQLIFMASHVVQTAIYVLLSKKFIDKKNIELLNSSSNTSAVIKLGWLRSFSFYFAIYLILYLLSVAILSFMNAYQIQLDYVILLLTSLSLYAIGYVAIGNPEIFVDSPSNSELQIKNEYFAEINQNSSRKRAINPELKDKLLSSMEVNKPYLKSDLKISELAASLSVHSYQLSQLINDEFSKNFYDFINNYRVEEAKKMLIDNAQNYTILAIAYEVGFNSKATFNRVFKSVTKFTPSEYKNNHTDTIS